MQQVVQIQIVQVQIVQVVKVVQVQIQVRPLCHASLCKYKLGQASASSASTSTHALHRLCHAQFPALISLSASKYIYHKFLFQISALEYLGQVKIFKQQFPKTF